MNAFATAGLGFNYKISSRFNGYVTYYFYKDNLTGSNSFYYDWEQSGNKIRRFIKSFGLGINYTL
ncbi:hypothetical protein ACFSKU_07540 [Pontibacter silvestris]|uniref:Outer membrane protein beta-barrel domain-containing protein n=1 Tax=Pontibacter silvestris TaxID=2305183 RepID=A0ABW4WX12_9BACT|nr:hypothetical protein [Pontibacter silvestris]MCC9136643.1 hypothetical protein [Pontibacter silvestris]